jgi:hypothetical protein
MSIRRERVALVLMVLVVGAGAVATAVHVGDAVGHSRVDYHGRLTAREIRRAFEPAGSAAPARLAAAEAVSVGNAVAPEAEPVLTLTALHVLPGLIVLVLAEVFRRGAALRDLERHTI